VSRRLEDKIRDLCNRAVSAKETSEVIAICSDLRMALNQYVARLRGRVFDYAQLAERRLEGDGRKMPKTPETGKGQAD
jgi:hypothetical protein